MVAAVESDPIVCSKAESFPKSLLLRLFAALASLKNRFD